MKTQKHIIDLSIEKVGSPEALANKLGVSRSFLYTLRCESNRIPFKKIKALAAITSPEITEDQIIQLRFKLIK